MKYSLTSKNCRGSAVGAGVTHTTGHGMMCLHCTKVKMPTGIHWDFNKFLLIGRKQ